MASHLASAILIEWGGPGGSENPPSALHMVIRYQSAQVPSLAPLPPGGGLTGPPEVAGVPPLLVEASLLFWQGVDDSHPGWGW